MKSVLIGLALALLLASTPTQRASAQELGAPEWMKQTLPAEALKPAWEEFKALNDPKGAFDARLAVLQCLGKGASCSASTYCCSQRCDIPQGKTSGTCQ